MSENLTQIWVSEALEYNSQACSPKLKLEEKL